MIIFSIQAVRIAISVLMLRASSAREPTNQDLEDAGIRLLEAVREQIGKTDLLQQQVHRLNSQISHLTGIVSTLISPHAGGRNLNSKNIPNQAASQGPYSHPRGAGGEHYGTSPPSPRSANYRPTPQNDPGPRRRSGHTQNSDAHAFSTIKVTGGDTNSGKIRELFPNRWDDPDCTFVMVQKSKTVYCAMNYDIDESDGVLELDRLERVTSTGSDTTKAVKSLLDHLSTGAVIGTATNVSMITKELTVGIESDLIDVFLSKGFRVRGEHNFINSSNFSSCKQQYEGKTWMLEKTEFSRI